MISLLILKHPLHDSIHINHTIHKYQQLVRLEVLQANLIIKKEKNKLKKEVKKKKKRRRKKRRQNKERKEKIFTLSANSFAISFFFLIISTG